MKSCCTNSKAYEAPCTMNGGLNRVFTIDPNDGFDWFKWINEQISDEPKEELPETTEGLILNEALSDAYAQIDEYKEAERFYAEEYRKLNEVIADRTNDILHLESKLRGMQRDHASEVNRLNKIIDALIKK
jgi:DNA mismatch repair ATPase MutS